MRFLIPTLILALITLLILWLMWRSWRRRTERDRGLASGSPGLSGGTIARFERVFYVATTPKDAPLERVAVAGLAYRGWAHVHVRTDGVEVTVTGEHTVTIPAHLVEGVSASQLTIDKVVERDGLASLDWISDRGALASNFRFASAASHRDFATSVDEMLGAHPQTDTIHLTKETP